MHSSSGVTQRPAGGQHAAGAVVKVEVPETVDILCLIAAHLQLLQALRGLAERRGFRVWGARLR